MYMPADRSSPAMGYDQGPSSPLRLLLNVLWLVCGGLFAGLGWLLAAAIMAVTIIGLPWCFAAFRIALYTFLPFGQEIRRRPGAGALGTIGRLFGNIVWFVLAGWWLAIVHLCVAVALALTIIGLPFAWAHLKLAGASLFPVGTEIVPRGTPYWG
jgi:uncharacterized membrane protein YccF (DUF307 family)